MRRNLRFIIELIRLRLIHVMVFRMGFFGPFFVDGSLAIVQLLVFQGIYSNVDRIGTWGRGEMVIFIGTYSLVNALSMVIYFFGVFTIPDKIRSGDMDMYLTKPMNPLLRLTFENVNFGSAPLVILSSCIILYGVSITDIRVSFIHVLGYLFLLILMTTIHYDLEVLVRTVAFFVGSTVNIIRLEEEGLELCMKLPGTIFKGAFKVLFYVILPYGIIATIPTQYLTNALSISGLFFAIGMCIAFTIFTMYFWKLGLKHYNSVSS